MENLSLIRPLVEALYPQDDWSLVGSTVVTGLVVVFLILILLVFILWVMGKILGGQKKKKSEIVVKVESQPTPAPVANAVDEEEEENQELSDEEVIAVISAAIAAYSAADGKQYKITSVKRREKSVRPSWGAAGVMENTRGFN